MKITIPLYKTTNPLTDTRNCTITYENGILYLKNSSNVILGERECTPREQNYLRPAFITYPKEGFDEQPVPVKKYTEAEIYERVNQLLIDARNIGINLNITTTLEED